jgi:hypothetical protein
MDQEIAQRQVSYGSSQRNGPIDRVREDGESIWPSREGLKAMLRIKRSLSILVWVLSLWFLNSLALGDQDTKRTLPNMEISGRVQIEGNAFFKTQELMSHSKPV